jgi:hypothetical protein
LTRVTRAAACPHPWRACAQPLDWAVPLRASPAAAARAASAAGSSAGPPLPVVSSASKPLQLGERLLPGQQYYITARARIAVLLGNAEEARATIERLAAQVDAARRAQREAEKSAQAVLASAGAVGLPLPYPEAAEAEAAAGSAPAAAAAQAQPPGSLSKAAASPTFLGSKKLAQLRGQGLRVGRQTLLLAMGSANMTPILSMSWAKTSGQSLKT